MSSSGGVAILLLRIGTSRKEVNEPPSHTLGRQVQSPHTDEKYWESEAVNE